MNTLIFKTSINTHHDFLTVRSAMERRFVIEESTIDLEDHDKVLRVISNQNQPQIIADEIKKLGFLCEELED
jgi:hypothetical protein